MAADLKNTPCAPGDYFKIDCNTCYCNIEKTGYLCTENLCPLLDSVNNTLISDNTVLNKTLLILNATSVTQPSVPPKTLDNLNISDNNSTSNENVTDASSL